MVQLGVAPAQQCLDTEDAAVLKTPHGLIVQLELVELRSAAQAGRERQPGERELVIALVQGVPRARCLRLYIAASARRCNVSASIAWSGKKLSPTLALDLSKWASPTAKGSMSASRMRA